MARWLLFILLPFSSARAVPPQDLPRGSRVVVVIGRGTSVRRGTTVRGVVSESGPRGLRFLSEQGKRYFVRWNHIKSVSPAPASRPAETAPDVSEPDSVPGPWADVALWASGTPIRLSVGPESRFPYGTVLKGFLTHSDSTGVSIKTHSGTRYFILWKDVENLGRAGPVPSESAPPPAERISLPPRAPAPQRPYSGFEPRARWRRTFMDQLSGELALGAGIMGGDTTYQIGGRVDTPSGIFEQRDPTSELDFPLNVAVFTAEASIEYSEIIEFRAGVKTNLTQNAGKMKDSDWGIWYAQYYPNWPDPDSLDIYSESDARLEALLWDARLRAHFLRWKNRSVFAGLGYARDRFKYSIHNLDEWYPSFQENGIDNSHTLVGGEVLRYDIRYSYPFVEFGERALFFNRLEATGSFGISPYVRVKYEDQHLLRDLVGLGDLTGHAFLFSFDGRFTHPKGWFLAGEIDFQLFRASGRDVSIEKGVYDSTIDARVFSERFFATLRLGFRFGPGPGTGLRSEESPG